MKKFLLLCLLGVSQLDAADMGRGAGEWRKWKNLMPDPACLEYVKGIKGDASTGVEAVKATVAKIAASLGVPVPEASFKVTRRGVTMLWAIDENTPGFPEVCKTPPAEAGHHGMMIEPRFGGRLMTAVYASCLDPADVARHEERRQKWRQMKQDRSPPEGIQ